MISLAAPSRVMMPSPKSPEAFDFVDKIERGHLVWHGDGESAVAEGTCASDGRSEIRGRYVVGDIDEGQPEFLEGSVVNGRPHRMVGGEAEQCADFEIGVDSSHGSWVGKMDP